MSLTKPKFEGLSFLVYMLSNFKSPKQAVKNFLNARFCLSLHYKNLTELSFKKKPQQKSSVTKVVQHPLSCFQVCFKFFFFWYFESPTPKDTGELGVRAAESRHTLVGSYFHHTNEFVMVFIIMGMLCLKIQFMMRGISTDILFFFAMTIHYHDKFHLPFSFHFLGFSSRLCCIRYTRRRSFNRFYWTVI